MNRIFGSGRIVVRAIRQAVQELRTGLPPYAKELAQRHQLPDWWMAGVAITRLDCRLYGRGHEPWTFDFSLVREHEWDVVLESQAIIGPLTLFHHVHPEVIRRRLLDALVGTGGEAPGAESMVDGRAHTATMFAYNMSNPYEVWDPALSFSMHAIAYDSGEWWQWRVGALEIGQRAYFRNAGLNLNDFEEASDRILIMRNEYYQQGHRFQRNQRKDFAEAYTSLLAEYRSVARDVFHLHQRQRLEWLAAGHQEALPTSSVLHLLPVQSYQLVPTGYEVVTYMEITYWGAALSALKEGRDSSDTMTRLRKFSQSVVLGLAAGETLLNRIAEKALTATALKKWDGQAALKRWTTLGHFVQHTDWFATSIQVVSDLDDAIKLRNGLMHYRPTVRTTLGGHVDLIPEPTVVGALKAVRAAIRIVAPASGYGLAPWLDSSPGWDFPRLDDF